MKKNKVYYWSPFLTPIATRKAVINSAYSINKFSKYYDAKILNFFGEFNQSIKDIEGKKIETINFYKTNFLKFLPKYGKFTSRISFLIFFIFGFYPLFNILRRNPPKFLIVHLITSLPLVMLILFNFNTKFILRISGLPRLNIFRKLLWTIALKKIYLVTCPTQETYKYLKSLKICDEKKLKILYDPIIHVKEIKKKQKQKIDINEDFFMAVGRLTNQKNFTFLCKCFNEILKNNPYFKLYIFGEGEDYYILSNYIKKNNLSKNIKLLGHFNNIFPYFKITKGFILSSLWEDPGFVLIEAAFCRTPVFSSDAQPGPFEIIKNDVNGTNFRSNDIKNFIEKFKTFLRNAENKKILLENLKLSKKFTIFNHYKKFANYLS